MKDNKCERGKPSLRWANEQQSHQDRVDRHAVAQVVGLAEALAIALYESFGFEREGLRKAHYLRDGVPVDAILMALLLVGPP